MTDIVANQQDVCWFCGVGSQRARPPVVWLEDGRGACGSHSQDLARLPLRDRAAA